MAAETGKAAGWGAGAALVLLIAGASSTPAGAQGTSRPPRPAPERSLQRVFATQATPQELRRRLAGLEGAALSMLFHAASQGSLPAEAGGEPVRLGAEERSLVREALAARPRRDLVSFLEGLASGEPELSARLEAQRLLASVGSAEHLKLLVRLTVGPEPARERRLLVPELRAGFGAALAAILARDGAALPQVRGLLNESAPELSSSIVDGLARVPSAEATAALAALLGRRPGLDPLLLTRLAERGAGQGAAEDSVREAVRRYLGQREIDLVCSAARACAQLQDDGAVEPLVDLVDHPEERVRASACAALERLTGLAFGSDATRWTSWYNAEVHWWEEQADALLQRIERGRGVEFARAARLALEHRLFRERIAEAFAQALRRDDVEEVRLACRALEQLRSPVAVRALVECLERPALREAAWKALRAITGVDLPAEADSWSLLAG